tara:strand:- start:1835 stop:2212 length:378 start_codon:yes stop_codon:yes gene_type:complete
MKKLTEDQVQSLSGAILTGFEHAHYLEEAVKIGLFEPSALKQVQKTLKHLIFLEKNYYNAVEEMDEKNLADKIFSNKLYFIDWMIKKFNHGKYNKLQEICVSFSIDPHRIGRISDKILSENVAKK